MQRILVTGAAGFIGQKVSEFLLNDGIEVIGVDNLCETYDVRLKEWRLSQLENQPGFYFRRVDICDSDMLREAFNESTPLDGVIHLAARAGVRQSLENPAAFIQTNITGTMNLLECCRQFEVPKFVLASTSSIYGANAPLPTPETADSSHPLQPYAASKKAAEVLCHSYHHNYGLDVTVFRYFTVYGPAARPDMAMFRFTQWIAEDRPLRLNGDGTQSRGFTYVDDIARGTILGLKPLGYDVINLGGHEELRMLDLIHMMESLLQKKARIVTLPFNQADMRTNLADITRARQALGWEPLVSVQEGVRNLVEWYLRERAWTSLVRTE
ncbi:MAG TPA: SDR family NAD(P)-dependent oxidoreductase [Anaerolineaceae bacterium]|jgi:nucleoside-diphosphate-sugar epimerase|nr:SDR family NAD(P)-dependent oxidoreductase [Longilinea sp.]HNS63027.1 SDR family NAD(P)-dependent oxidoreductase [Anaerolineaceae bacterium]HOU43049.1 SDR family NAD(P)-dependent oxidoreductase [Anaerolineaceae bacterium]HQF44542.1 SDR family NAD(P)-dependent oxidoreductase [Anaerolineaceae bacterium]HQH34429.1 SDR family NAD(P)-dependent oxidoreductase [Anaerolineaceae bacterium]